MTQQTIQVPSENLYVKLKSYANPFLEGGNFKDTRLLEEGAAVSDIGDFIRYQIRDILRTPNRGIITSIPSIRFSFGDEGELVFLYECPTNIYKQEERELQLNTEATDKLSQLKEILTPYAKLQGINFSLQHSQTSRRIYITLEGEIKEPTTRDNLKTKGRDLSTLDKIIKANLIP